jgi:hypothetical protein
MVKLLPYLQLASRADNLPLSPPTAPLIVQHYLLVYGIMSSALNLTAGGDGKYHPNLTFAAMAYDAQGNALGGSKTSLDAAIPADQLSRTQHQGYQALQNLYVPLDATSLRLAVRDGLSSRMGSLVIPLPLAWTPAPPSGTTKH